MPTIQLPTLTELTEADERGPLALLRAALLVTEQALQRRHAECPPHHMLPICTTELLLRKSGELRCILDAYEYQIQQLNPGDDDIPF